MTRKYYFKNLISGLILFSFISFILMKNHESLRLQLLWGLSLINAFLYPVAKLVVERIALKFTEREFWYVGFFKDDIGKNGLYAIYWLFCFMFAIPLGIIYFLLNIKKAG